MALLYRAINAAYATTATPQGLDAQLRVLNELRHRGRANAAQFEAASDALLRAHRFEDARHMLAAGGTASWPRWLHFEDRLGATATPAPTLWTLDASGTTLQRQPVDLAPAQILVTAGCHYAEDAARAIAADPELSPAFRRHARWLSLPPGSEDFLQTIRTWNREHPHTSLQPIYDRDEWSVLPPGWEMPTFYLVRHGRVIAQTKGWPSDPRRQRNELKNML